MVPSAWLFLSRDEAISGVTGVKHLYVGGVAIHNRGNCNIPKLSCNGNVA